MCPLLIHVFLMSQCLRAIIDIRLCVIWANYRIGNYCSHTCLIKHSTLHLNYVEINWDLPNLDQSMGGLNLEIISTSVTVNKLIWFTNPIPSRSTCSLLPSTQQTNLGIISTLSTTNKWTNKPTSIFSRQPNGYEIGIQPRQIKVIQSQLTQDRSDMPQQ